MVFFVCELSCFRCCHSSEVHEILCVHDVHFLIAVVDVRTRLRSLRTMFRKAINMPTGSAGDTLTPTQKALVKMCSFLKSHLRSKPTFSTLPPLGAAAQV